MSVSRGLSLLRSLFNPSHLPCHRELALQSKTTLNTANIFIPRVCVDISGLCPQIFLHNMQISKKKKKTRLQKLPFGREFTVLVENLPKEHLIFTSNSKSEPKWHNYAPRAHNISFIGLPHDSKSILLIQKSTSYNGWHHCSSRHIHIKTPRVWNNQKKR